MEALTTVEKACEEKLLAATKAKVSPAFLSSGDAGVVREMFSLPEPPEMFALDCLPPLRSSAGPTLLPASPKFVLRAMYPRYRSRVKWKGCFGGSQGQQFSLLAGFLVPAHPCRHRKAGPVLAAWPAGAPDLHPMPVCPSYRKSWLNSWTCSRHEPSRRCSLPSPESPCPRSRWAWAFSDPHIHHTGRTDV